MIDNATVAALVSHASAADALPDWPAASWDLIRRAGVLAWAIPGQYGGRGLDRAETFAGNEALASACLTTTFILSQRDAAIRRVVAMAPPETRRAILPAAARGELFLTIGLSQLTTSRQHRPPALVARLIGGDTYRLDGEMPWVTGADQADFIVTGAALEDGRTALFLLPPTEPGVTVGPPLDLAALVGSRTTWVRCEGVVLGPDQLLAGPATGLLGAGTGGGPETSCLALGLAGAAIQYLEDEADHRPDLAPAAHGFAEALNAARRKLSRAGTAVTADAAFALRAECTGLVLRATQAALLAAKGAGFVSPHPAQRWARQAMFFLVWSCPQPIGISLLAEFAPVVAEPAPVECAACV